MICPRCKSINDDDSSYCEKCGTPLKNTSTNSNKNIFIALIAIFLVAGMLATGLIIAFSNNNDNPVNIPVVTPPNTNSPSWHKINSFNGVGDDVIAINTNGKKIKVVSTAMPLLNYDENFMITTISNDRYTAGVSELTWNENSALTSKTTNIEFTGSGTYYIFISAYELDYWNIEVYEWY